MSEELKCQHCGAEIDHRATLALGYACFDCDSWQETGREVERSRLCRERSARRNIQKEANRLQAELAELLSSHARLLKAAENLIESWQITFPRLIDLQEVARIAVEYIEDPERRAFYRKQIVVAGTDAFQKGGAR